MTMPMTLHTSNLIQVALFKLNIRKTLKPMPRHATSGRYLTLYGLLRAGSFLLNIHTAAQIIEKASSVPMLVICVTFSIGVTAAIIEVIPPTINVLFHGVLNTG